MEPALFQERQMDSVYGYVYVYSMSNFLYLLSCSGDGDMCVFVCVWKGLKELKAQ